MVIPASSTNGLQLATAAQVLAGTQPLRAPLLISNVDSIETLTALHARLIKLQFGDYLISLFGNQTDSKLNPLHGILSEVDLQTLAQWPMPLTLYLGTPPVQQAFQSLVDVVAQLRNPEGGCPWDLEQTPQTLTPYILEEAYESVEAIHSGKTEAIAEELGDLLLQVVLQAQIASETQDFSLPEVIQGITEKLIRRHPHVFGDTSVNSIDEVRANWDQIKADEKGESLEQQAQVSYKMGRYTKRLPPLMAGLKLSEKAAAAGLEWPNLTGVWRKFYEELAEFQEALIQGDVDHQLAELGDLFFTLVNVARWCNLDPSQALMLTNQKLIDRVESMESRIDKPLTEYSLAELDQLWTLAKQELEKSL